MLVKEVIEQINKMNNNKLLGAGWRLPTGSEETCGKTAAPLTAVWVPNIHVGADREAHGGKGH